MRIAAIALLIVVTAGSVFAQEREGLLVQNPLDEIREALAGTLQEAGLPFSDEQLEAIALVMDEQRRATENLFGQVFNFSGGPPLGVQLDRALAGIAWMTEAFLDNVDEVLTPEQNVAWLRARMEGTVPEHARLDADAEAASANGGAGTSGQISQIRINNNPYTAESRAFRNEIITRGGIGDFHGNVNFTFQNHLLNARNAFAGNRPEYVQRNLNVGFNGPVVPGRLTINVSANQNNRENVGTISAITPEGTVSEGITRPALSRYVGGSGQLYVSDREAIHFSVNHQVNRRTNQGIGGITLQERARNAEFNFLSTNVRSLTQVSTNTMLDVTVNYNRQTNENRGVTSGVAINVRDAFQAGGSTSQNEGSNRTVSLNSLLIRTGDRLTLKAGADLSHYRDRSQNENGFNGEFEFASLEDFLAATPTTYTVSAGESLLEFTQTQAAAFLQNDLRVSRRLTLMFGLRYEVQSNLSDWNNLDPRFGYAYALDDATVLRGGIGLFHNRLFSGTVGSLLRLDGTRQQELVVRNPSYPNPFLSGETEVREFAGTDPAVGDHRGLGVLAITARGRVAGRGRAWLFAAGHRDGLGGVDHPYGDTRVRSHVDRGASGWGGRAGHPRAGRAARELADVGTRDRRSVEARDLPAAGVGRVVGGADAGRAGARAGPREAARCPGAGARAGGCRHSLVQSAGLPRRGAPADRAGVRL